jgi:hypothetical protein
MNVSASSLASLMRSPTAMREAAESPAAPDNDGDSDDIAAAPSRAATAPGIGQQVDVFA